MFEICNMHISCIFQVRAFSIGEEESYSRDIGNLFPAATGEASSRGFCVSFVIREILGWYRGPAWRGFRSFKILSFLSGKTVGTCAVSRQDCWQDVQPSHDRYKQIKDCAAGWSRGILVKWLTRRNAKSGMHYPSYPSRDALMIGRRGTDFGYRLCEENSIFRFPFSVPPNGKSPLFRCTIATRSSCPDCVSAYGTNRQIGITAKRSLYQTFRLIKGARG